MTSARSEPAMSRPSLPGMPVSTRGTANVHGLPRHGSTGVGLGHYGIGPAGAAAAVVGADRTALAASVNDVDFGLATCLATPMDPVEAETRPFGLPSATTTATTTAAARCGPARWCKCSVIPLTREHVVKHVLVLTASIGCLSCDRQIAGLTGLSESGCKCSVYAQPTPGTHVRAIE